MTADERFLTEVKWEANLSAVWTSASQSHKAEARGRLLSDRAARIEQVERLRGLLRHAAQRNHPDSDGCSACAAIRSELAREGQGGG